MNDYVKKMENKFNVAGIQFACSTDTNKNLETALTLSKMAIERGAKIICYQELFNLPWFPATQSSKKSFQYAENVKGPTIKKLRKFAKDNSVVLVCPFYEKEDDGIYYNSAAVIDADGKLLGLYRKTHIPEIPYWHEKCYFKPGNLGFPVFDTAYGKIAVQICWDVFFPEIARIYAMKGAKIIFAPTASDLEEAKSKWEKVLASSAITNGVFVFRVNRVGNEKFNNFYGHSFCLNPHGEAICGPSGSNDGILVAEIDLSQVEETRKIWPFLRDRREEIFGELIGFRWVKYPNKKKD